jgi:hypothetical protein
VVILQAWARNLKRAKIFLDGAAMLRRDADELAGALAPEA